MNDQFFIFVLMMPLALLMVVFIGYLTSPRNSLEQIRFSKD